MPKLVNRDISCITRTNPEQIRNLLMKEMSLLIARLVLGYISRCRLQQEAPVIPRCHAGETGRRAVGREAHQTFSAQHSNVARKDILQRKEARDIWGDSRESQKSGWLATHMKRHRVLIAWSQQPMLCLCLPHLCPDVFGREDTDYSYGEMGPLPRLREKVNLIEDDGRFWCKRGT